MNGIVRLSAMVAMLFLGAGCKTWGGGGGGGGGPKPTTGTMQATLMAHVLSAGGSVPCQSHPVRFTFTSSVGSAQQKDSMEEQVQTICDTVNIEGTTSTICWCPATVVSSPMAPGSWTVTAQGATCTCDVKAGVTKIVKLFNDGTPCSCGL